MVSFFLSSCWYWFSATTTRRGSAAGRQPNGRHERRQRRMETKQSRNTRDVPLGLSGALRAEYRAWERADCLQTCDEMVHALEQREESWKLTLCCKNIDVKTARSKSPHQYIFINYETECIVVFKWLKTFPVQDDYLNLFPVKICLKIRF